MRILEELPQVSRIERVAGEADGMYTFVEDAGRELPNILATLREQHGITPKNAEPYLPAFDEVFVRLIQKSEQEHLEVAT
jgi:ABC-2 type transport system ATP-binding protein